MSPRATRYLPHAVLATMVVALLPIGVVWGARAERLISSPWVCVCVTVALSLVASAAGNWYWKRRPSSGDVLFSELLLWGWLRRVHVEHQLDDATKALGLATPAARPSTDDDGEDGVQAGADRRLELLTQLAHALEAHDPYVDGHSRRVARHASMVARKLGLPAEEVAKIGRAAAVHDVGKLRLPREVLMKPTALTDAEFEVIKRHSTEGAEMVACLGDPELTAMVRHHHERLDGSGYPAGLSGTEIPLGARIIAVADTFDAITSARPYRPPARHKQAIDILIEEAGVHLDADAVRAFVSYYSGSRVLVLWAVLAAMSQRAVDWARRIGGPSRTVSATPTAASAAATLAISAVAVIPPIGLGHLPRHAAGRHQDPFQQLAAASVTAGPIALRAGSSHHAHVRVLATRRGVRRTARRGTAPRRVAGGLPVVHRPLRIPRTAPRAGHRSSGSRGAGGTGSAGRPTVSPGLPSPRPSGGSSSGHGGGNGGGSSGGSGGVQSGRSGSGLGTPARGSSGATTSSPVAGTTVGSGGATKPGVGGMTGATTSGTTSASSAGPVGGTTGGTTSASTGGSTGGTAGGTTSASTGGSTGATTGGTTSTGTGGSTGGTTSGSTGGTTTGGTGGGTPATQPTTKAQCMSGGYTQYGFKNQGLCIACVEHHSDSPGRR